MGYRQEGSLQDMFHEEPILRAGRRTTDRVGDDLKDRVKRHTPVAHRPAGMSAADFLASRHGRPPGTLRESWQRTSVHELEGHFEVSVLTHDPTGPLVEWETRPHTIRPRPDRAPASVIATGKPRGTVQDGRAHLRFEGAGGVVYAKEVHHPGTRGAHMMATSLTEEAATWERIGREEMERWSREQFHG